MMTDDCHWNVLFPVLIFGFIVFSYLAYVLGLCIFIVEDLLESCLFILFFNILVILLLWTFLAVVFIPVAQVPPHYKLTDEEAEVVDKSDDESRNGILEALLVKKNLVVQTRYPADKIRYCSKCKHIKPDRSRHCSSCGVCILKMDHHCPFVNNCIGFSNYKNFILLQFYTTVYCLYIMGTSLKHVAKILTNEYPVVVICFFVAVFYGLFGATLLGYHLDLIRKNRTTIDQKQGPILVVENGTFDLGCCKNFKEVFGNNCLMWWFPVFTSLGNGETFPIRIRNSNRINV